MGDLEDNDAKSSGRKRQGEQVDGEAPTCYADELPPRIPAGAYEAICTKAEIGRSFGGRRDLYIRFVISKGPYSDTELFMACTYPTGKISHRFKLYNQWCLAMGRCPKKGERISGRAFTRKMYEVLVRDTQRGFPDGRLMPGFLQYSVVDTIIRTLVGVPSG